MLKLSMLKFNEDHEVQSMALVQMQMLKLFRIPAKRKMEPDTIHSMSPYTKTKFMMIMDSVYRTVFMNVEFI